jgi:HAD superfamily hydrolase (TIGR01509 family)
VLRGVPADGSERLSGPGPRPESGPAAVLFDVDGTLVDSVDLHAEAWQRALLEFGRKVPYDEVRRQIGKGGDQLMPAFLSEEEVEARGEALDAFRADLFEREYRARAKPFPGARDLVARVRADGRAVALASSGKEDDVAFYRKLVGLDGLLDAATTSADAERSKPHPDIFEAALARTGKPALDAIAVGDSPWDALAAKRAGIRTIGVLCGGFAEADLRDAGCIAVFRDPADLLARYDESPLAR